MQMRRLLEEEEGEGGNMVWPGWFGDSQACMRDLAAAMVGSGTGHWPIEFWSSLESTKGC